MNTIHIKIFILNTVTGTNYKSEFFLAIFPVRDVNLEKVNLVKEKWFSWPQKYVNTGYTPLYECRM